VVAPHGGVDVRTCRGVTGLAATIEELRAAALAAEDAAGHFPAMYARVTAAIQAAVHERQFTDSDRTVSFAASFATWYLRPHAGAAPMPGSWQAARDVAGDRRLLIVQHLFLGINAHVNFDLPQVVADLGEGRDIGELRADFDRVNDVLAATVPAVLRDLGRVSRWINVAASRGGTRLFDFSLLTARRQAWTTAVRLHGLPTDERQRDVAALDEVVRALAYLIANPGMPASLLVPVGRLFEVRDPKRVTEALLGDLR
jgi:hypothetical protein